MARQAGARAVLVVAVLLTAATGARAGVSGHFASARWHQGPGTRVSGVVAGVVDALGKRDRESVVSPLVRIDPRGRLQVRVSLERLDEQARADLAEAGLHIEIANEQLNTVRGWAPAGAVWRLAALANVKRITPPDYALTRAGAVVGEHDGVLRCNQVRATFGLTGAGVRLGIISDGIDHLAASQASGDAPSVTIPPASRCRHGSGDEGTAIVEIVHDCAPGVEIGFCGPVDDLEMIDCIACLKEDFGVDVIVDDLGFSAQPFFADGPVAQAVKGAVDAGVAYFSAAGNSAQQHYQGRYQRCGSGDRHQFATADCTMDFRFVGSVNIVLQWDEPFGSASSNYDLCVPGLGCSEDVQSGDGDPVEGVVVTCGGPSCPAGLEIYKRSGADAILEVFFTPVGYSAVELFEHRVTTDSIFGHQCVPGSFAVGAIDASQPQQDVIESFSARGPCTIKFPSFESRLKPDITGVDGISNTGPGNFPSPFFGTSASAPGVAAVAALLLELDPSLTVPGLREVLASTSVDLGTAGADITYGYGRCDALAAAQAVAPPDFATRTPTATPSHTSTHTVMPSATPSRSPLPTPGPCYGDCDDNGRVTVNELIKGVGIMLGTTALHTCGSFDVDSSGSVTVDEMVRGVNAGLNGCHD